jgi:hypothetical protein
MQVGGRDTGSGAYCDVVRCHASDFESGVRDLRCADATRPCQETQTKVR